MSQDTPVEILKYNKRFWSNLGLWPEDPPLKWYNPKDKILMVLQTIVLIPIFTDLHMTLQQSNIVVADIAEHLIEIMTILMATYGYVIYNQVKYELAAIIKRITNLQRYHTLGHEFLVSTEWKTKVITQYFFFITLIFCHPAYISMQFFYVPACMKEYHERSSSNNYTSNLEIIPCGLELKSRFPFDVNRSFLLFLVIEIIECVCSFLSTTIGALIFIILVHPVVYITDELNNLAKQIILICDTAGDIEEMERRLTTCIQYHMEIIEISEQISEKFKILLGLDFLCTGIGISFIAVNLAQSDPKQAVRFFMEFCGWVTFLLIPSVIGQRLIDESEQVAVAAYESRWYEAPVHIQKGILLIILRSQRCLSFNSGALGYFSHETFVAIMRMGYSVFTLMSNANEEE